jgi:hypothetical protein
VQDVMCDTGKALDFSACLVRDQEDGGSNPFAPTSSIGTSNLHGKKKAKTAWIPTRRSPALQ